MLVFGITIAIIFIMLFFFAFRLVSKVLYFMFMLKTFGNMMPKFGGQKDANNNP